MRILLGFLLQLLLACCRVPFLFMVGGIPMCSAFTIAPSTLVKRSIGNVPAVPYFQRNHLSSFFQSAKLLSRRSAKSSGLDPKRWSFQTPPFVAVRHFTTADVNDEKIQEVLDDLSITTMDALKINSSRVAYEFIPGDITDFSSAIKDACSRRTITIEEILGGKILYDTKLIPKDCFDSYIPEAASVKPDNLVPYYKVDNDDGQTAGNPENEYREPEISLVLGSSGSGKTIFALRGLPSLFFGEDGETSFCGVHIKASKAREALNKLGTHATFPQAVASVVQTEITKRVSESPIQPSSENVAQLFLHVVLDEAGGEGYAQFLDSAEKINQICEAVKTMVVRPAFARGVRVTVVGTGLDQFTADMVSVKEVYKFRMQPWTAANVDALVDKLILIGTYRERCTKVKEIVHGYPILEDLSTNARCAYFLVTAMKDNRFLRKNRLRSFVNAVVFKVAELYLRTNGLAELDDVSDKWIVARAVFSELDRATRQRTVPFFPDFTQLPKGKHRAACRSLLDVHVESTDGTPNLVQPNKYAFSMSRALVIVVINLLSTDVDISWDWESFETVLMLSEFKEMIVQSDDVPKDLDRLIVQLRAPFPATNTAGEVFHVPLAGPHTVILNGPKASYADVIAPYRLAQAKFSINDHTAVSLDIQKELDKMGVTYSSGHKLQQSITKIMHLMWMKGAVVTTTHPNIVTSSPQMVNKEYRFQCYPINTLISRRFDEKLKFVVANLKGDALTVEGEGFTEAEKIPDEFDESHPLTVVFATNCCGFDLGKNEKIEPGDVDSDGRLMVKSLPTITGLRPNVNIRFLFF